MKRTNKVRLTESQLHKVIKESVKQVLSGLDWKTYANAAKKAEKIGDPRFEKFSKASDDAFNSDEWINSQLKKKGNKLSTHTARDFWDWHGNRKSQELNFEKDYSNPNSDWKHDGRIIMVDNGHNPYEYVEDEWHTNTPPFDEIFTPRTSPRHRELEKDALRMKQSDKEMRDYYNGNYEYVKGIGWKLKKKDKLGESIRRAIRNVLR